MADEVPVERRDLLVLAVASLGGGLAIAAWLLPPALSPQFLNGVMVATMLLAFFLFIPVMGARLFLEDWREGDENR